MVSGQRGGEGSDPPGLVGCREHVGFFLEPWGAAGRGFLEVREGCESRLHSVLLISAEPGGPMRGLLLFSMETGWERSPGASKVLGSHRMTGLLPRGGFLRWGTAVWEWPTQTPRT